MSDQPNERTLVALLFASRHLHDGLEGVVQKFVSIQQTTETVIADLKKLEFALKLIVDELEKMSQQKIESS